MPVKLAITMPMHNGASSIRKAVLSIISQKDHDLAPHLFIADDASTDDWFEQIKDLLEQHPITVLSVSYRDVVKVRNHLLDHIYSNHPEINYIARLDCDDVLSGDFVFKELDAILSQHNPDVILMGNSLTENEVMLSRENRATADLMDDAYLYSRLHLMSQGVAYAELPSCNLVFKRSIGCRYPDEKSGEDHWLLVDLLSRKHELTILTADILYASYNLSGTTTASNKSQERYIASRKRLLSHFANLTLLTCRQKFALNTLLDWKPGIYAYLGEGLEAVVFRNSTHVCKVYVSQNCESSVSIAKLHQKAAQSSAAAGIIFPEEYAFEEYNSLFIESSIYEPGTSPEDFSPEMLVKLYAELFSRKIAVENIAPKNTIVTNGSIRIFDWNPVAYSDNRFLNMAARGYFYSTAHQLKEHQHKAVRSLINNFSSSHLDGFPAFLMDIFTQVQKHNLQSISGEAEISPRIVQSVGHYSQLQNTVSLAIKACIQDCHSIYPCVTHIVDQLSSPDQFVEKVIILDRTTSNGFLRQYTDDLNEELLMNNISRLLQDGYIDRVIEIPGDEIERINNEWFALSAGFPKTVQNMATAPHLYGFEQLIGDYILQMDSDVIFGRTDRSHSFLTDMIQQMKDNDRIMSVSFNINHGSDPGFQSYFGLEEENFAPDVRCCLLDRNRLLEHRPYPNALKDGRLELSWYRSIQKWQKESGFHSIRGGDYRSFYIHPQNFRKKDASVWFHFMDRIEQLQIPRDQVDQPEIIASFHSFCIPKRSEPIIFITAVTDKSIVSLEATVRSTMTGHTDHAGMIIINESHTNILHRHEQLFSQIKNRLTVIQLRRAQERIRSLYQAIHYFCNNSASIIFHVDSEAVIVRPEYPREVARKMTDARADLCVIKTLTAEDIRNNADYKFDFLNIRKQPEQLENYDCAFTKELFDSLNLYNFMKPIAHTASAPDVDTRLSYSWQTGTAPAIYQVPLIEISRNPVFHDSMPVVRQKPSGQLSPMERELLQHRETLQQKQIHNRRYRFTPATNKIEIDITYACNLKCIGCNRSCQQAPDTHTRMSKKQIDAFIADSIANKKHWTLINILGGEPTLHPEFVVIIKTLLEDYIEAFSPGTRLQVTSNGFGKAPEILKKLPSHPQLSVNSNSFKTTSQVEYFTQFNNAPVDDPAFNDADFSSACWVVQYCGVGLNPYGYYCCAAAAGIDRLLQMDMAVKNIAGLNEGRLREQADTFCRYCGNFFEYAVNMGDFVPRAEKAAFTKAIISPTWKQIYSEYDPSRQSMKHCYNHYNRES